MIIELRFEHREWDALLKAWEAPAVNRTLRAASSAFGRAAKPIIRAEVPVAKRPRGPGHVPGNLRRQTKFQRLRAGIGVVVGPLGKKAWYGRLVAGGTKAHIIRAKTSAGLAFGGGVFPMVRHPGTKPNDYIGRAQARAEAAGYRQAEEVLFAGLDGRSVSELVDN